MRYREYRPGPAPFVRMLWAGIPPSAFAAGDDPLASAFASGDAHGGSFKTRPARAPSLGKIAARAARGGNA